MPTYEYACQKCQHRFSVHQRMSDDSLETCPECGGRIERVITGGAGLFVKKSSATAAPLPCGHDAPCCGAEERCGFPPCQQH